MKRKNFPHRREARRKVWHETKEDAEKFKATIEGGSE
jgi:hypothetical protein